MDYEAKIWNLWLNNGSTKSSNSQMQKGLELLQNGKLDKALLLFKNYRKKNLCGQNQLIRLQQLSFCKVIT